MKTLISAEKQFKVLGFTESVTDCDCCGKSNLKGTYVMQHVSGTISYFGCVCAATHDNYTKKEFLSIAKQMLIQIKNSAKSEYKSTIEFVNYANMEIKQWEMFRNDVPNEEISAYYYEFVAPLKELADAKKLEIASKYLLKSDDCRFW